VVESTRGASGEQTGVTFGGLRFREIRGDLMKEPCQCAPRGGEDPGWEGGGHDYVMGSESIVRPDWQEEGD